MAVGSSPRECETGQKRFFRANRRTMPGKTRPLHVSLVAIPDAVISTLTGIYDVLGSFRMLARAEPSIPAEPPFTIEIVASQRGSVALASGMPVEAHLAASEV